MKVSELIQQGKAVLPKAEHEVNWLAAHFLGCGLNQVAQKSGENVAKATVMAYKEALYRRAAGEPLQYILGRQEFMSLDFKVTPQVLIPRWDSEVVVEKALNLLPKTPCRVADIATGSGALAVSIAHYAPHAMVEACDISESALAVAMENALSLGVSERVAFYLGDLAAPLTGEYDLIISNPPYITEAEMLNLPKDVLQEPHLALYGGKDGLIFYRRLAEEALPKLKCGGFIIVETGDTQTGAVASIFEAAGLREIYQGKNYDGKYRYVLSKKSF